MASFSTTPAEVINLILSHVLPEDLENFAQCCKVVHQQANRKKGGNGHSLLEDHRISIRKHSSLTELKDVEPLLKAMTADQHLGSYVRRMDFGPRYRRYNWNDWRIIDPFEDKEIYELLLSAAQKMQMDVLVSESMSSVSRDLELRMGLKLNAEECMKQMVQMTYSNTDLAIALLIPLLPNLTVLSFEWKWTGGLSHWTDHCIEILADRSVPMPTKIREVNVRSLERRGCTMAEIIRLTSLPSLKKLVIWDAQSPPGLIDRHFWSQRQSYPRNTITHLTLRDSRIETWILHQYLRSFGSLQTFHFNARAFDPMPLFHILRDHSATSLTTLSLRSHARNTTAKPPFKQLINLKTLWVDWQMLLPEPYIAGPRNWDTLLPQLLETLTLHDTYDPYSVEKEELRWTPPFIKRRFNPIVEALIAHCETTTTTNRKVPELKHFGFSASSSLQHNEIGWRSLAGIEEVEKGFRERCAVVGVGFVFRGREREEADGY